VCVRTEPADPRTEITQITAIAVARVNSAGILSRVTTIGIPKTVMNIETAQAA
jgi:hypothetical protein